MGRTIVPFVDMDGVICDFTGAFKKIAGEDWGDHDYDPFSPRKAEKWALIEKYSSFYENLPWVEGSKEFWNYIFKYYPDLMYILSSAGRRIKTATQQKISWLNREIPQLHKEQIIIVLEREEKARYAALMSAFGFLPVLIDDYIGNIQEWEAAGGIGILFENPLQALRDFQQIESGE